jgi:hypothetical protein
MILSKALPCFPAKRDFSRNVCSCWFSFFYSLVRRMHIPTALIAHAEWTHLAATSVAAVAAVTGRRPTNIVPPIAVDDWRSDTMRFLPIFSSAIRAAGLWENSLSFR